MRFRVAILLTALAIPRVASAETIGTFDWVSDELFGTGSTFNVTNESTETFSSVFVDLYAPSASDPFQSVSFGDVTGGTSSQSIDDLSLLLVPFDLDRARLRFTFGTDDVVVELLANALVGSPGDVLLASIDIEEPEVPSPTVPEPSTLLLLLTSAGASCWRFRATGRSSVHRHPCTGDSPRRL